MIDKVILLNIISSNFEKTITLISGGSDEPTNHKIAPSLFGQVL